MAKGKGKGSAVAKGVGKGMAAPKEAVEMPAKVAKGAAKRGKRGM